MKFSVDRAAVQQCFDSFHFFWLSAWIGRIFRFVRGFNILFYLKRMNATFSYVNTLSVLLICLTGVTVFFCDVFAESPTSTEGELIFAHVVCNLLYSLLLWLLFFGCMYILFDIFFHKQIFRHGDRNPIDPYPNDPYRNLSYWPEGLGQLTNVSFTENRYFAHRTHDWNLLAFFIDWQTAAFCAWPILSSKISKFIEQRCLFTWPCLGAVNRRRSNIDECHVKFGRTLSTDRITSLERAASVATHSGAYDSRIAWLHTIGKATVPQI